TIQTPKPAACNKLLQAMLKQYKQYISLAAFNSNGQLLCSSATTEVLDIANQPHFLQALKNKQLSSTDYTIHHPGEQPTLAITKPIMNTKNEIQVLLNATINLAWLDEHVQKLPLYSASLLTMFDSDGTVLFQYPPQTAAKSGHKYPQIELIKTAVRLKHLGVMERSDEHGTDLIHAYAPLNDRSLNTYITVSIPADVVLRKANQALEQNLILAALITLAAIMIAFAWSHRLFVNPIQSLAEAATQVRQGKLNTQIENNHGPKELSQLGITFNQMTTALQHRADDQARIEHSLGQLIQQHRETNSTEFLVAVAAILADTLEVDYCLIGLTGPNQHTKFYSCVFWGEGKQLDNLSINTLATPHEALLEKERFRIYRNDVQQLFPDDPLLHELNIKSYAGISLTDVNKTPCGLLVVMNNRPIINDEIYHSLLQVFAARITVELEREQTERQRQHLLNEARLAATAFESHEGMFITDSKRNTLRVNHAFSQITGYHESEIIGRQPDLLFANNQTNHFSEKIWQSANEQMKWSGEAELNCKNGSPFPVNLTISSVKNDNGKITHYVAHFQDISERKLAAQKIQHQAFHDALTNLPNRTLLLDRLETTLSTLKRRNEYGALMFIDLDHFKHINDSLGHPVGDALLISIAERLTHSLRQEDSVARLGGDEFVVLLPQLNKDRQLSQHEAHGLARKLLRVLSEEYNVAGHTLKTSVSIGIAIFPDHNLDANDILRHADLAMYSAKDSGRGSVKVFESEMQTRLIDRLKLENELKQAHEQGQF
ncbi:MAG TPA: diguanylate cyclase, partial [Candidatus Tenderia electrophaga]|nr:diguanylate cyclase [Candidatus Tenderia electrophaga]